MSSPQRGAALALAGALLLGILASGPGPRAADLPELTVSVGGGPDVPAYLPVHVAASLDTFVAEGVRVTLRRAKHPTAAVTALRDGEAAVAVTTTDQAIRGAAVRGTPVRVVVAHNGAPGVALLVSPRHREHISRIEDLRDQRVGIPGPGTTGHVVLTALLQQRQMGPWQLQLVSLGGQTLAARVASGELAAAVVDEPWASRALEAGAVLLLDLRRAEDAARHLGGAFYEVVSVTRAAEKELTKVAPALAAYARALVRVQAWLAATPPVDVALRLPPTLIGDRERFRARFVELQGAVVPDGEATVAGLTATLAVLRAGSPWPVTLKLTAADLREPAEITKARTALGVPPPAP